MYVPSRCLLQVKIPMPSNGLKKGGGQQTDSLKKRCPEEASACMCVCVNQCVNGHCVYVCLRSFFFFKFFSPAGGALMATGMRSTPTHLPSQHYVVASSEGLYVLWCHFYPLWKHIYTHTHTTFISTCLHWHMAGSYLAQLFHYPHILRPALPSAG